MEGGSPTPVGRGFSPQRLGELAAGRETSTPGVRAAASAVGRGEALGGQEPPQGGRCWPACPGSCRWPGDVWFCARLTLPAMLSGAVARGCGWQEKGCKSGGGQRGAWPRWVYVGGQEGPEGGSEPGLAKRAVHQ